MIIFPRSAHEEWGRHKNWCKHCKDALNEPGGLQGKDKLCVFGQYLWDEMSQVELQMNRRLSCRLWRDMRLNSSKGVKDVEQGEC